MGINENKKTLLIVDDEPGILEALTDIFSIYYNVVKAENGIELVKKVKENSEIDAIISDIQMPQMSGIEAFETLRKEGIYIPFMFLTGYGEESIIQKSFNLGAIEFLDKPFNVAELIKTVNLLIIIGSELKKSIGPNSDDNKIRVFNYKLKTKDLIVEKLKKVS